MHTVIRRSTFAARWLPRQSSIHLRSYTPFAAARPLLAPTAKGSRTTKTAPTAKLSTTTSHAMSTAALPSALTPALVNEVREFWLKDLGPHERIPNEACGGNWFGRGRSQEERDTYDGALADRFGAALHTLRPAAYALPAWQGYEQDRRGEIGAPFLAKDNGFWTGDAEADAQTALGFILLFDQIPRNIYRSGEPMGWVFTQYDRIARSFTYAVTGVTPPAPGQVDLSKTLTGTSLVGDLARGMFIILPLMHSEDLADHDTYLEHLTPLPEDADDKFKMFRGMAAEFEGKHRVILEQFGRYPHRNECQGRETTAAEQAFLDGGGDTFNAKQRNEEITDEDKK